MFFFFAQSLRQPEDTRCKELPNPHRSSVFPLFLFYSVAMTKQDDLEQNANTSFFPPCVCISFHFKGTQSAALWELTYLMGRSLRISFRVFLMFLALIISRLISLKTVL
ncbi:uncharacterized protein LOC121242951 [Juglans microcarpa x Juglans regia]|uniref:uncharacterized protein LOC121242951 n=1 Tax=Juglans microcarpa x Juglans regia TaxID=2249226 RepID=UPI001B7DC90D|nr:uncharacterized protein LOC121242951 [Juglans microcarpa x Juglans regia]XP_040996929.1 uncharacterized protein LOC121242951 [Juglans microcarpa x Juglans regia]XP_040996930.1 uncharacterized protein LOC121242951 [Juglans microcarpa x Juglans regia]